MVIENDSMLLSGSGGAGGGPDAAIAHTANSTPRTAGAATTYTWVSQSIGATDPTRRIIVGCIGFLTAAHSVSSVTVGSTSLTFDVTNSQEGADGYLVEIWSGAVGDGEGTTADIAITFNSALNVIGAGFGCWRTTDMSSTLHDYASAGNKDDPQSGVLTIPAGGVGVGISIASDSGAGSAAWSGLSVDYNSASGDYGQSGASLASATLQTDLTVDVNWTGTPDNGGTCWASWERA